MFWILDTGLLLSGQLCTGISRCLESKLQVFSFGHHHKFLNTYLVSGVDCNCLSPYLNEQLLMPPNTFKYLAYHFFFALILLDDGYSRITLFTPN
jgi:hypothetical protein